MSTKRFEKAKTKNGAAWLATALVLAFLSGCASKLQKEAEPTTIDIPPSWDLISQKLESLRSWKLIGKIGIRTPVDSMTAAINKWHQADSTFVIDLSSTFFGLGASKLYGTPDFLTIVESGADPISSYNPELLILQSLGIPLPISSLSWWVKGIPTPNSPYDIKFNQKGYSAQLTQNDWHLSFSKHKITDDLPLPGKIKLERDNVRIILAIKQWTPL